MAANGDNSLTVDVALASAAARADAADAILVERILRSCVLKLHHAIAGDTGVLLLRSHRPGTVGEKTDSSGVTSRACHAVLDQVAALCLDARIAARVGDRPLAAGSRPAGSAGAGPACRSTHPAGPTDASGRAATARPCGSTRADGASSAADAISPSAARRPRGTGASRGSASDPSTTPAVQSCVLFALVDDGRRRRAPRGSDVHGNRHCEASETCMSAKPGCSSDRNAVLRHLPQLFAAYPSVLQSQVKTARIASPPPRAFSAD